MSGILLEYQKAELWLQGCSQDLGQQPFFLMLLPHSDVSSSSCSHAVFILSDCDPHCHHLPKLLNVFTFLQLLVLLGLTE